MIQTRLKKIEKRFLTPPAKYIFLSADNKTWTLMRRSTKLLCTDWEVYTRFRIISRLILKTLVKKWRKITSLIWRHELPKIFEKYSLPYIGIITLSTRLRTQLEYHMTIHTWKRFPQKPHFNLISATKWIMEREDECS